MPKLIFLKTKTPRTETAERLTLLEEYLSYVQKKGQYNKYNRKHACNLRQHAIYSTSLVFPKERFGSTACNRIAEVRIFTLLGKNYNNQSN